MRGRLIVPLLYLINLLSFTQSSSSGFSERVIFQREVDAGAEALGLVPFQVAPSQVMTMKIFDCCGPSYSKIGTEILPFSITPADAMYPLTISFGNETKVNVVHMGEV
jgi:hypothetical protein